jgi:hypothetical protein
MQEAQRSMIKEHVRVLAAIGQRWEAPESPNLSSKGRKVQDVINHKGFGCHNEKVAALMSILLEEDIRAPIKVGGEYPRGMFLTDSKGATFVYLGSMRNSDNLVVRRKKFKRPRPSSPEELRAATIEEILAFIDGARPTMLRNLATIVDHEINPAICSRCGPDCDCDREDDEEDAKEDY